IRKGKAMTATTLEQDRTRAPALRLGAGDNVVVAIREVPEGTELSEEGVTTRQQVPQGHKIATRPIQAGAPILKFETVIGYAAHDILPGEWMHSHNIRFDAVEKDYAFARDY